MKIRCKQDPSGPPENRPSGRKPPWLKRRLPTGAAYENVRSLIQNGRLHTVCQEAKCPNIWECFSEKTATFLILGDRCTRDCRFCAVAAGPSGPPDPGEPERVALAAETLGLRYAVITSVTRDDLADGGSGHFAETIRALKKRIPEVLVEVLIPDFQGSKTALETVLSAGPDVLNHNLETVPRLYPEVRPEADYHRSLTLLDRVRASGRGIPSKSGIMLGLGEQDTEIRQVLADLLSVGCTMLTVGQYLQPSRSHLPVTRYVPPEEFDRWKETAKAMGFSEVASAPFVRSSYHAHRLYAGKHRS
ncbi:MAG: lipoyl synthase [Desulfobacteraceae bacterium]|nr:lipoyl synthase [Desulfobacteraceae bacterium]